VISDQRRKCQIIIQKNPAFYGGTLALKLDQLSKIIAYSKQQISFWHWNQIRFGIFRVEYIVGKQ